jgi:trehalose 6-phosphate synthase/phosphatase
LVSGRPRVTCDAWFGDLPLELWAEHGLWHRPARQRQWMLAGPMPSSDVFARIQPLLDQFTVATPGSRVEPKSTSIAWHYRRVESVLAANRVRALRAELAYVLSGTPFEMLEGQMVIEIRPRGIGKAIVAARVLAVHDGGSDIAGILAMGDDRTDEDLFGALPPSAVTIAVGNVARGAMYRVPDYRAARAILQGLATGS